MDEKDLLPAPPLESTSASSSSKENDGEEEKAKIAQTANASSSTKEEEREVEKSTRSFPDLPSIVMEYILAHFSYYEVLQMRLISSSWNDLIKGYLNKADEVFQHNLARHNVQWLSVKEVIKDFKQPSEEVAPISRSSSSNLLKKPIVPKMSPRYHHCACYLNDSMYIFGGCIAPNTAYNDLWRFDMTSKHWTRIIAAGTPPLPRIFCSFTPYETADEATGERRQYIVLFGGFLFDENLATRDRLLWNIHLYDIAENRWTQLPIGPLVEEEGSKSNQQNQNSNQNQQPPQSQQQQLLLRSGNHSAVVIGDELIVFNGLRYVSTLGSGPASTLESEVPCNHVYAFHLREHCWRRVDGCPADQPGHHHRVSPRKSVRCPLHFDIRSTLEATQPMCTRRKAATQTPVALDAHHILYICGCSSNVLFIGAFLLTRERCHQSDCELCLKKKEEEENEGKEEEMTTKEEGLDKQQNQEAVVGDPKKQKREGKAQKKEKTDDDTRWKWAKVEISKEGLDFEFTHGVEFCKVGNMMAYLTAKDVAVPVRRHPPPPPPPPPPAKPKPSPSSSQSSQPTKSSTPPPLPPRSQSAPSTSSSSSSSSSSESAARAASVATVFPSIPPLHHFRGPQQHVNSHASNRQLLRERRIESLDYYQRQFEQLHPPQQLNQQQQQLQNQQILNQQMLVAQLEVVVRAVENGHYRDYLNRREEQENAAAAAARASAPALPVPAVITRYSDSTTVHRSSLQLSLLDISRVITERRIERVRQRHEMDYSVVPEALAAYSLVAAPSGLLLFGGYVVNTNQPGQHSTPRDVYEAAVLNEGPAVSSKLFIIASKPEMRLY